MPCGKKVKRMAKKLKGKKGVYDPKALAAKKVMSKKR